jgi:uncharacterized protein (DUF169 family)
MPSLDINTAVPTRTDWGEVSERLTRALHLTAPPVALTFRSPPSLDRPAYAAEPSIAAHPPATHGASRQAGPLAPPNEHGRTGSAPAGCVFWIRGTEQAVTTYAADHANCSVGSLTHGFRSLDEVIDNDDVQALLASGWVDPGGVTALPVVTERPESITYSPLASCTETPTVVLVRLNARGLMTVKDAVPDLPVEGKPQCHIVAIAKEQGRVAASVGCALSRARTGMRVDEATCVFPAETLPALVGELEHHAELDSQMAHYAADDARRFTTPQPGVPEP